MIQFEFCDKGKHVASEELEAYMMEQEPLLRRAQAGEEQYRDNLGWLEVDQWAGAEKLMKLEAYAAKVKKDGEVLVVIGIGGSNQAARAVIEALVSGGPVKILYAGNNVSPDSMKQVLEQLEGKSVYLNVIAKNFETLEPGAAFRILRQYMKQRYGAQASERIFATGTRGSWLDELCGIHGYTFLDFPDNIGGRYSSVCDVGLFPMAVAGLDIQSVAEGARQMEQYLRSAGREENPAFRYAAVRSLLYQKGYRMEMLASFEPQLHYFNSWWTQLFAESEGKEGKGLYPVSARYSEDLHSIGQFVQEGTPVLFETFLQVESQRASIVIKPDQVDDRFDYLDGKDLWEISKCTFAATLKAHSSRLPCSVIKIYQLNEYSFGQLFYFFEFACYLSGSMLGINPFDQPGVENYKGYMFEALGKFKNK